MNQADLIDTAGIASFLGCSQEHATNRIVKKAGFPQPKINLSQKMRKWDKDDVMNFLQRAKPKRKLQAS